MLKQSTRTRTRTQDLRTRPNPGLNIFCKDNCKPRRETFKFWDLLCLILEIYGTSASPARCHFVSITEQGRIQGEKLDINGILQDCSISSALSMQML